MSEPKKPSFRNLTDPSYGKLKDKQNQYLQELTKPHIESFNYFLHEGITKIIENMYPNQFELPNGDRVSLTLQDFVVGKPKKNEKIAVSRTVVVYPSECRGRNTSYRSPVQVQVGFSVNGVDGQPVTRSLGQIPTMVKSDACNLSGLSPKELVEKGEEAEEMGGYFITNGVERLLRMLILPRRNYPMCLRRNIWKTRGPLYTEFGISIRCVKPDQIGTNNVLHYLNNGTTVLNFNHLREMFFVPVIIILKGLLPVSDKFIYDELIRGREDNSFYKGCVVNMFRQALLQELSTMESVLEYIGQRFRIKTRLPGWFSDADIGRFLYKHCIAIHLDSNLDKFNLLVHMTQKLFDLVQGKCASDSPDNPMNQEVLLSGAFYQMFLKEKLDVLLYNLQLVILKQAKAHKAGSENFKMTAEVLMNAFRYAGDLSNSMMYLIATGNATSHSGLGVSQQSGLTVVADKLNFMRYISHFRCIHRGSFFAQMRTTSVRKLLPEAWGFLCPVHTPDGTPCGLMNHMSLLCQIQTVTFNTTVIEKVLYSLGVCPFNSLPGDIKSCYTVLMDGKLIGYVSDSMAPGVEQKLRMMKIKGLNRIPPTMEVCLVPKTEVASQYPGLFIFTTPARMMRPVINLAYNMVEMIGTMEQVYMNICITQAEAHEGVTTHQELNESTMLSFVGHLTPFSDFNQSPRNMYQCQMGKQTMGVPCHSLQYRSDFKLYSLQTPQSPLVRPVQYDKYEMDNYPLGTNAIVAVISYTGYDMEDAMVINKSSFERGFGHASVYKSDLVELSAISKEYSRNPLIFSADPKGKAFLSGQLDKDGLPPVGRLLQYDEPYFSYVNMQSGEYKINRYKSREPAYVEHVRVCGNEQGTNLLSRVKIMTRTNRNPVIGDKFASRHGQKGVCSMMYPVENLPFTESGMTPDIIFNPHGYPSRMTIGMMIESMAGKAAASYAECYDASPFTFSEDDSAIDHFGNLLVKAGYNYYGTERLYSGTDGREMEADIFMGVVYYQRLRHMVSDKFQVRTTGPIDQVTHQPVKGRKRQGGVRFGEMERDALISHGTSFLLQDRLLNCSDKSAIVVCTKCGNLLSASKEKPAMTTAAASFEVQREWSCLLCKETKHMQLVTVPYVLRYLVAELASMNICMDVKIKS